MIAFANVSKQYGGQVLFVEASFQVNPGEKIGLVGANGAGKSTVFRLIVGDELPDDGQVERPKKLTLGYFRQDVGELKGRSILAETCAGAGEREVLTGKARPGEIGDAGQIGGAQGVHVARPHLRLAPVGAVGGGLLGVEVIGEQAAPAFEPGARHAAAGEEFVIGRLRRHANRLPPGG